MTHPEAASRRRIMHSAAGVPCTTVVHMAKHKPITPSPDSTPGGTRLSVTLPADHYRQMQQVAARKKVSMAWVVRDAVDHYLATNGAPSPGPASSHSSARATPKRGGA